MSWGTELWDKQLELGEHTQKGIDFCEKYSHYVKERSKVEQDYAAALRKLAKNYLPKKKEEDEYTTTAHKAFVGMMREVNDIAGQHDMIAENLQGAVFKEVVRQMALAKHERKKQMDEAKRLMASMDNQRQQLMKSKKRYEAAFREQERAEKAFNDADANINLSRAEVEKARGHSTQKLQLCNQAKTDYASVLEHTNQYQKQHYHQSFPKVLQCLQEMDETRINGVKKCFLDAVDIDKNIMPIINTCLANTQKGCSDIDAGLDSRAVIERYKSGYEPPADIPFEDLDTPNQQVQQGTPRPAKIMARSTKKEKGKSKSAEPKEDFSQLPPNQQKKQLTKKITEIKNRISKENKERQGMVKLQEVYAGNAKLGNPKTMEPKLRENEELLNHLDSELRKFEDYFQRASSNGSAGLAPGGSGSKGGSFTSLNSSNAGDMSVGISTPAAVSHPTAVAPADGGDRTGYPQQPPMDNNSSPPVTATATKSADEGETDEFDDMPEIGKAKALYSFEATNEGSISMDGDETYGIIEPDQGDGWTRIRKTTGEEGFVPTSYIEATYP